VETLFVLSFCSGNEVLFWDLSSDVETNGCQINIECREFVLYPRFVCAIEFFLTLIAGLVNVSTLTDVTNSIHICSLGIIVLLMLCFPKYNKVTCKKNCL
jgi:hypothetical protein